MNRAEFLAAARRPAPDWKDDDMILASSYPFLNILWSMLIFFAFVAWIWILITVFADLFRRHDTSGWVKVLWIIFIIVLPFLGVFVYLIAEHEGMTERAVKQQQAQQSEFDDYVKSVAAQSDPTEQIAKAKQLLDSGAITQAEFDQMKQKALAS
jgi:putative oligomerization/nucleic acid binding protein/phospholipase D-like protein